MFVTWTIIVTTTTTTNNNKKNNNNKNNDNHHNDKQKIILEKLDNLYDFKNQSLFIKIDVERHEDKLIDGSLNIIKNNK